MLTQYASSGQRSKIAYFSIFACVPALKTATFCPDGIAIRNTFPETWFVEGLDSNFLAIDDTSGDLFRCFQRHDRDGTLWRWFGIYRNLSDNGRRNTFYGMGIWLTDAQCSGTDLQDYLTSFCNAFYARLPTDRSNPDFRPIFQDARYETSIAEAQLTAQIENLPAQSAPVDFKGKSSVFIDLSTANPDNAVAATFARLQAHTEDCDVFFSTDPAISQAGRGGILTFVTGLLPELPANTPKTTDAPKTTSAHQERPAPSAPTAEPPPKTQAPPSEKKTAPPTREEFIKIVRAIHDSLANIASRQKTISLEIKKSNANASNDFNSLLEIFNEISESKKDQSKRTFFHRYLILSATTVLLSISSVLLTIALYPSPEPSPLLEIAAPGSAPKPEPVSVSVSASASASEPGPPPTATAASDTPADSALQQPFAVLNLTAPINWSDYGDRYKTPDWKGGSAIAQHAITFAPSSATNSSTQGDSDPKILATLENEFDKLMGQVTSGKTLSSDDLEQLETLYETAVKPVLAANRLVRSSN